MNNLINSAIVSAIVALLLLLAGSSELYAQDRGQPGGQGRGMRQPPSVDQIFTKDDKDGDGLISKDEFGGKAEHFSRFDTDGDGYLTREEVTAALQNRPQRGGGGQGRGDDPRSRPNRPAKQEFTQMDTDGDGVISAEEFTGPPDHFALIDTDQDGALTKEELINARDRIRSTGNGNPPDQAE